MKSVVVGILGSIAALCIGQTHGIGAFMLTGLAVCFILAYLESEREDHKGE